MGALADLEGLVYLCQPCSAPVLLRDFVPPEQHFGDSLRGPHTLLGRSYTSDAQGGPCTGYGKFVSLANTEFEKRN
jgi:hypothetical protein